MEADRGAVRSLRNQTSEHLAGRDGIATLHGGPERLVGGSLPPVIDRHHPDARDRSGERDASAGHGSHGLADPAGQVDAPVARAVLGFGEVECAVDAVLVLWPVERPGPRPVAAPRWCRRSRDDDEGQGDGAGKQHVHIPRRGRGGGQAAMVRLGRAVLKGRFVDFVDHGPVP